MEADFSVEIGGPDDPVLDVPWSAEGTRYYDLRAHPELLAEVPEAVGFPELWDALVELNSPRSPVATVKCDAFAAEISLAEEIFGADAKFGGYIDFIFDDARRFSFETHERMARECVEQMRSLSELPASAELIIRRALFHNGDTREGFYVTLYVFGYGSDEDAARAQWARALRQVTHVVIECGRPDRLQ